MYIYLITTGLTLNGRGPIRIFINLTKKPSAIEVKMTENRVVQGLFDPMNRAQPLKGKASSNIVNKHTIVYQNGSQGKA